MSVKANGHFGSKGEITRKIASEEIPVVALLKKVGLIDIRTLHIENAEMQTRFGVSSLTKKIDSICSCPFRNKLDEGYF